jgi:hypothetical protein
LDISNKRDQASDLHYTANREIGLRVYSGGPNLLMKPTFEGDLSHNESSLENSRPEVRPTIW